MIPKVIPSVGSAGRKLPGNGAIKLEIGPTVQDAGSDAPALGATVPASGHPARERGLSAPDSGTIQIKRFREVCPHSACC